MTTKAAFEADSEVGGAVAFEWIASTAAAIGLCLCLVAAQGERTTHTSLGHGIETQP